MVIEEVHVPYQWARRKLERVVENLQQSSITTNIGRIKFNTLSEDPTMSTSAKREAAFCKMVFRGYLPTSPIAEFGWLDKYSYNTPKLNDSGVFFGAREDNILTLYGCEHICGDGYQIWRAKETISRLTLWVVPGLVLVANFQFPPLPLSNTIFVIIHAIGDPIDSLWSILTRREVQRRLARLRDPGETLWDIWTAEGPRQLARGGGGRPADGAWWWGILGRVLGQRLGRVGSWFSSASQERCPERDVRDIATVLAAYEEVGWKNAAREFFEGEFQRRRDRECRRRLNERGERFELEPFNREALRPAEEESQTEVERPTEDEILLIMEASHELSAHRLDKMLTSWVAILTLFISLVAALVRTVIKDQQENSRLDIETAHTIAVVTLLFIFIPLIKLSGDIGTFAAVSTAVNAIEKLNAKLEPLRNGRESLFPPLQLEENPYWDTGRNNPQGIEAGTPATPPVDGGVNPPVDGGVAAPVDGDAAAPVDDDRAITNIRIWPDIAGYYGMNSSWRPDKKIPVGLKTGRRSLILFAYSLIFVAFGSAGPAIFLSATNRADKQKVGFGCRSTTWSIIFLLWFTSFVMDFALRSYYSRAKTLWIRTIIKDGFFVVLVLFLIMIVQVGFLNSCWCRSNVISSSLGKAYINLNPYSAYEWRKARIKWSTIPSTAFAIILLLLVWSRRSPLCKSQEQLQGDLVALKGLQAQRT
ncbi:MAG: hypothetical protein M1839_006379 [Geoglossum umbratile]|nr:MAG: hypothetical protein M1839_006379 [Geoglossum umbratile]